MINPRGFVREASQGLIAGPGLDAMHRAPLVEQQIRNQTAVLAGDANNQCVLHRVAKSRVSLYIAT